MRTDAHVLATLTTVAVGVVVLVLASSGIGAPEDHAQAEGDWASRDRVLWVDTDRETWFRFSSRPEANQSSDVLEGRFIASSATYEFEFQDRPRRAEGPDDGPGNASWTSAELDFVALVEYQDRTGDRAFHPPTDEVVHRQWLAGNRSSSLAVEETANRTKVATASFPFDDGGVLEIVVRVSPSTYQVRDRTHPPTVTAVDVRLEDYPYRRNDTEVALLLEISTPVTTDLDTDRDHVRIPTEGEPTPLEARFAWTRDLTGAESATNPTTIEVPDGDAGATGSRANLLFTYPRDEGFVHATTLGVHRPPTITQEVLQFAGNWYVFGGALAVSAAVLGGSMYVKLRGGDAGPPYS